MKKRKNTPKRYEYLRYSYNAIIDELKQNGTNYKTDKTDKTDYGSRDVIIIDIFFSKKKGEIREEIIYYFDKNKKCEKVESIQPVPFSLEYGNHNIITIKSVDDEHWMCKNSGLCEIEKYTYFDLPVYKWKGKESYYSVPYTEDVNRDGMIDIVTFLYFRDAPKP